MSKARNLLLFVAAIAGGFVYICNAIPQIESSPVDEEVSIGESPEELVAAGETIFMSDRAQCLTCHSVGEDPKARCPNLEGVGERAPGRKSGLDAAGYLIESVYNPNAFIVPGFPKNQMTPVNKPPIALSHDEILAVTAFLNTSGGATDEDFVGKLREAQSPWRQGLLKPDEGVEEVKLPILPGDAKAGKKVFEDKDLACNKCHRVGSEGPEVGPELTAIGASQSADYILESVLEPSAVIVKGYKQIIVLLDTGLDVRGTPLEWIPDKDHPRKVRLGVLSGGEVQEKEVDLANVESLGDTVVGVEVDGDPIDLCGEYVPEDDEEEEGGVTLMVLAAKDGGWEWEKQHFTADQLEYVNTSMSPMPENFSELLTPRKMYDLVAYLLEQKNKEVKP